MSVCTFSLLILSAGSWRYWQAVLLAKPTAAETNNCNICKQKHMIRIIYIYISIKIECHTVNHILTALNDLMSAKPLGVTRSEMFKSHTYRKKYALL